MQRELALVVDHGVARVAAALIPDNDVVLLGEQIHHSAFAFIAPVDAYYSTVAHFKSSNIIDLLILYTFHLPLSP